MSYQNPEAAPEISPPAMRVAMLGEAIVNLDAAYSSKIVQLPNLPGVFLGKDLKG